MNKSRKLSVQTKVFNVNICVAYKIQINKIKMKVSQPVSTWSKTQP